jgi:hypothetical protein
VRVKDQKSTKEDNMGETERTNNESLTCTRSANASSSYPEVKTSLDSICRKELKQE